MEEKRSNTLQLRNANGHARVGRICEFLTGVANQETAFLQRLGLINDDESLTALGQECKSESGLWYVRKVRAVLLQYVGLHDIQDFEEEFSSPAFADEDVNELLDSAEQFDAA